MQCPKPKTRLRSCSAVPSGRTRWHRMYQCVDARQGGCGRSRRESHPIPTRTLQPILIQSLPQPNPYCAAHTTLSSFNHASNPPDTTTSQPQPPSRTHELIDVLTRLPITELHKSRFARRESALPSQTSQCVTCGALVCCLVKTSISSCIRDGGWGWDVVVSVGFEA